MNDKFVDRKPHGKGQLPLWILEAQIVKDVIWLLLWQVLSFSLTVFIRPVTV
jgi:hypothetical protein